MDLVSQFNKVKDIMSKKWKTTKYIGYFQANTNTYAPLNELKEKYESILSLPNVIGLNIATRSDAISDECYDYLEELNKKTDLIVELGLQSINEDTLKLINRGHDLNSFEQAVKELQKRNIKVVVHIINGLPHETKEDMINTVKYLNKLDIQGIKIHMLSIIKDTPLAELYEKEHFHVLTKEEYIDIVVDQLEYLRPEIVIHRITGDPDPKELIEPTWLIKKFTVLNDIDKEMVRRDTYQGVKYK
jgi:radical SAM protein (TIGR01212 family)